MNYKILFITFSIFITSHIYGEESLFSNFKPNKEAIATRAKLSIKQQRPDIAIDDLVLYMIEIKCAYLNEDATYQKAVHELQIYAEALFYMKSTKKIGPPSQAAAESHFYKTVAVIVAPDISTDVATINDGSIHSTRRLAKIVEQNAAEQPATRSQSKSK